MGTFGRRSISIIMSVIMVLSCFSGLTFSVGAETSGDYGYKVLDDGTVSITKYNGSDEEVAIPSEIEGKKVTAIGYRSFSEEGSLFHYLKKVIIPDTVTLIGEFAFIGCTELANIDIPNSVIYIDDDSFYGCTGLSNVIIPDNVTYIGWNSFYGCTGLTSVTMGKNVRVIYDSAFVGCTGLSSINIPSSVNEIGFHSIGYSYDKEIEEYKKIDGFTIYGYSDTIAEKYANENGFKFEVMADSAEINQSISSMSVGDTVTFGSYPQTDVTSELGSQLTAAAPSTDEWTSYNYYYDGKQSDYMKYCDLSYNGGRYRGVFFTEYRQKNWRWSSSPANQEENGYYTGTVYWFRYDPLTWRILDPSTGYVICENTIDSQPFNNEIYSKVECYNDETYTHYANNWEYSTIRSWLNKTFFVTAFSSSERSKILSTNLTTPAYSTSYSEYDVGETFDCVFLPSYQDMLNSLYGFSSNSSDYDINRKTYCSDYSRSQGLYAILSYADGKEKCYNSIYRLRSAGNGSIISTKVCDGGNVYNYWNIPDVNDSNLGIRPALCLNPSSTIGGNDDASAEKCIAVFSTERSLSINPGGSFNLGFGITDGEAVDFDSEWKQMSLSVGDPSVISVSDYVKTDCGYYVTITGLKEGKSSVTVTDTDSGANMVIEITVSDDYIKTYSYKIDKMREFYPDNNRENHLLTNIYNQNGLYVNNYKCEKESGKYHVTFDVYNETYYAGAVDVYDKNGLWQGYCEIKKNHDISSLKDTIDQTYYLISDYINKKLITYAQRGSSEYTNIDIYIPEGGYFTISNNMLTSPGTYLTNAFEIVFDAATSALSLILSDSVKTSALSDFKKEMGKDFTQKLIDTVNEQKSEAKKKAMQKVMLGSMQDKIKEITKNYANRSLKDMATQSGKMFSDISVWAENVFNSYEINWKGLYSAATGISESLFTKFAGFPGLALDAYFSFSKGTQKIAMAYQMARSLNVPYSIIYSSFDDGYVTPDNVIVHTDGNIDSDAVLQVFKIGSDDTIDAILNSDDPLEAYEIYNISFVKNDTLVQPNGKVKVYLPIPDGMAGNTCKVYRRESDGTWTVLDAYIEGSYLVFETDHFSVYALVGNRDELVITSPAKKTEYEYGETLDTSGLVLSYAGEEIKRGYICSPSVLIGSGEQEITVAFGLAQTKFTVTVNKENSNDEGLKFIDSDTDGIIDEAGGKVYIYPKNIGGITVYEFKSLFENEIKVNFDDGENAFNGMAFMSENHEYILIIKGDTQANGKINASDARTILRIAARLEQPDDVTKDAADVDSDGKVTSKEARIVLRFAAKLQSKIYE